MRFDFSVGLSLPAPSLISRMIHRVSYTVYPGLRSQLLLDIVVSIPERWIVLVSIPLRSFLDPWLFPQEPLTKESFVKIGWRVG